MDPPCTSVLVRPGRKAREEWAVMRSPDDTCVVITMERGIIRICLFLAKK